ncbi:MAG: malonate decarboxylase holo-[acyl-carrier-protein] synthase [Geothrix sp.]|nr:malonate decarboxylase holo-[acyl-carrier-protein] synthase [Geothrix sp.]
MRAAEPFHRHDWVWLRRETPLPDLGEVRRHMEAGRPFIVARHPAPAEKERLSLGLALPDKRRIGFAVAVSDVSRSRPPLSLEEVRPCVPGPWAPTLQRLAARFAAAGMEARVYGSAAWQALTGLSYLREDSDLDLLLAPATEEQLRLALGVLVSQEGTRPRLDGELVLPDGGAVAWREAASGAATLLVKTLSGVSLLPRATWMSALQDPAHA